MIIGNAILNTRVMHTRLRVRRNKFVYKTPYILLDEHNLPPSTLLFGLNQWGITQFRYKDYGQGLHASPFLWVRKALKSINLHEEGRIYFLTQPRQYGYIFNPANFYFCVKDNRVWALMVEVHNTFGERHFYLMGDGKRPLKERNWYSATKTFHVSPFFEVKGSYTFSFVFGEKSLGVWINYYVEGKEALKTSITGRYAPFTSWGLLRHFILKPWMLVKVPFLIHWQALILWLKGVAWFKKPPSPEHRVTRGNGGEGGRCG